MVDAATSNPDAAAYGFAHSDKRIQWSGKRRVPWSFRIRRYLVGFALAMLPPVKGSTVFAWLWLPLVAAGSWAWFWFIGLEVRGGSEADDEFRWMAYICGWIVLFILVFAPSAATEDRASRRDLFRSGTVRRTAVVAGSFAIQVGARRWIPIRLTAIMRVRRALGVVAVQLPSGKYWSVPSELFPSRPEWRELVDHNVGYPVSEK